MMKQIAHFFPALRGFWDSEKIILIWTSLINFSQLTHISQLTLYYEINALGVTLFVEFT